MAAQKKVMRYMLKEYYGIPAESGGSTTYYYVNTGFTQMDESGGAQVDTEAFIGDKNASTTVTGYENGWEFDSQYIKGDPVSKDIRDIAVYQKTGTDCERELVSIDLTEPDTGENEYKARKFKIAVEAVPPQGEPRSVTHMTGTMHQLGDYIPGTFNVTTMTFTPETASV
ncbi:MAG: hypothetical protein SOY94_01335 [Candidatus Limiplasma sp.]|nr:hypothetical protein [Candidatus Limiplasma sp.]